MRLFLFIPFSLIWTVMMGQVDSRLGRFSADFVKGCAPLTINITEDDDFGNISRAYTYEPGARQTVDTFYTYSIPGTYQIIQLIGATIDQNGDTLTIEVLDPVTPEFDLTTCSNSEVFLTVKDSIYDAFEITSGTTSILLDEQNQFSTSILENAITNNELSIRGILSQAKDNCGVASTPVGFQPLINSIEVEFYEYQFVCEDEINLMFEVNSDSLIYHEIQLEDGTGSQTIFSGNITGDEFQINNISVDPEADQLCFRFDALSLCDGRRIEGQQVCDRFLPTEFLFDDAYASYVENDIVIRTSPNSFGSYLITKRTEDVVLNQYINAADSILDESINPLRQYTYEIVFETDCGSDPLSTIISAPYVISNRINSNQYEVSWIPPEVAFESQLSYSILLGTDSNGYMEIANPENPITVNLDLANGEQQQLFLNGSGMGVPLLRSNTINLDFEYVVYIPRAFTPDGDGLNDQLELFGLPSENFTFRVFNRWGETVFETSTQNQWWDGKTRNGRVIDGAYSYTLEFLNEEGELFYQEGSFVVLKR